MSFAAIVATLVLTFHPFNFKVRDLIRKNFHILKNDPETSAIFSNNPLVSFRTQQKHSRYPSAQQPTPGRITTTLWHFSMWGRPPISGSNDSRKRHEMRLISKLGTLHSLGMNERFSYI